MNIRINLIPPEEESLAHFAASVVLSFFSDFCDELQNTHYCTVECGIAVRPFKVI